MTRKITRAVARIKYGIQDKLFVGNLGAKRDRGFAPEYVEAMWLMVQQPEPDDFVIATGEAHSVREFVELGFASADLDWKSRVELDPKYYRPAEVDVLVGDASKAKAKLDWWANVQFGDLVRIMVEADLAQVRMELYGTSCELSVACPVPARAAVR